MKGDEITKPGFYWYRSAPERSWKIGQVSYGLFFWGCGSDECLDFPFAPGVLSDAEFVGPIKPPWQSGTQLSDDELVQIAREAGFDTDAVAQLVGLSGKSAFDERIFVAKEYPVGDRLRRFAELLVERLGEKGR